MSFTTSFQNDPKLSKLNARQSIIIQLVSLRRKWVNCVKKITLEEKTRVNVAITILVYLYSTALVGTLKKVTQPSKEFYIPRDVFQYLYDFTDLLRRPISMKGIGGTVGSRGKMGKGYLGSRVTEGGIHGGIGS